MTNSYFIDFHCHLTLKPYGRSFRYGKTSSRNPEDASSIFHYNPPLLPYKSLIISSTLTKFSQSSV